MGDLKVAHGPHQTRLQYLTHPVGGHAISRVDSWSHICHRERLHTTCQKRGSSFIGGERVFCGPRFWIHCHTPCVTKQLLGGDEDPTAIGGGTLARSCWLRVLGLATEE